MRDLVPSPGEEEMMEDVEIIVVNDYDGYFESFVRTLLRTKKTPVKHKRIQITAGPWRSYMVQFTELEDGETLGLDFYSAFRTGFGSISQADLRSLQEML